MNKEGILIMNRIALFCAVDDFCQPCELEWSRQQLGTGLQ